jgi:hypothetical protein
VLVIIIIIIIDFVGQERMVDWTGTRRKRDTHSIAQRKSSLIDRIGTKKKKRESDGWEGGGSRCVWLRCVGSHQLRVMMESAMKTVATVV